MHDLWRHRDFRCLLVGQLLSALGDWTATLALLALALRLSSSPVAAAGMLVLRLAPGFVAAPLAARVASRWDRRRTMLAMDASRVVMVLAVPLLASVAWVYLWAFLIEAAGLLFLPARDAAVPDIVESEHLAAANSLLMFTSYGAIPAGAALFSFFSIDAFRNVGIGAGTRYGLAFLFDALTFVASFALVWPIAVRDRQLPAGRHLSEGRSRHFHFPVGRDRQVPVDAASAAPAPDEDSVPRSFRSGLRIPLVRWLLPATVTAAVGIGSLFTLGLPFVRQLAGGTATSFGLLVGTFGAGACVGAVLVSRFGDLGLAAVRAGVAGQGTLFIVVALAPSLPVAFAAAAGFGASAAATLGVGMRCVQTDLDDVQRRLALTVFHVVIRIVLTVAALAAGVVASRIGARHLPLVGTVSPVRQVLLVSGLIALVGALLVRTSAVSGQRRDRTAARRE